MITAVILSPSPGSLIQYADPKMFRFAKFIVDEAPPSTAVTYSPMDMCGVGSEAFCTADGVLYRKWADGTWSATTTP